MKTIHHCHQLGAMMHFQKTKHLITGKGVGVSILVSKVFASTNHIDFDKKGFIKNSSGYMEVVYREF